MDDSEFLKTLGIDDVVRSQCFDSDRNLTPLGVFLVLSLAINVFNAYFPVLVSKRHSSS